MGSYAPHQSEENRDIILVGVRSIYMSGVWTYSTRVRYDDDDE